MFLPLITSFLCWFLLFLLRCLTSSSWCVQTLFTVLGSQTKMVSWDSALIATVILGENTNISFTKGIELTDSSLTLCHLLLFLLFFREPEKRVGEKKPAGSTSPPAGSPAPPAAPPSSAASTRSAYLSYSPAFSVLLQCLKMVHTIIIVSNSIAQFIYTFCG